jgi:predicted metal-binding membrane protein
MATAPPSALERAVGRDRAIVVGGIATITLLSWLHLVRLAATMQVMPAGPEMAMVSMPAMTAWSGAELATLFLMWAVMMVAMMLPSAAPLLLLVAGTYRRRGVRAHVLTLTFAAGYLLAWTAFSGAAAVLQLTLHRAALLSDMMVTTSAIVGGVVLLVAGAYQWLPLKGACLTHCRSPLAFLSHHWREGVAGALAMGTRHGVYCVGCCWALMALLFVAGVMNLAWVGMLAIFVLLEKVAPHGAHLGRLAGLGLVAWGVWVLAHA